MWSCEIQNHRQSWERHFWQIPTYEPDEKTGARSFNINTYVQIEWNGKLKVNSKQMESESDVVFQSFRPKIIHGWVGGGNRGILEERWAAMLEIRAESRHYKMKESKLMCQTMATTLKFFSHTHHALICPSPLALIANLLHLHSKWPAS